MTLKHNPSGSMNPTTKIGSILETGKFIFIDFKGLKCNPNFFDSLKVRVSRSLKSKAHFSRKRKIAVRPKRLNGPYLDFSI